MRYSRICHLQNTNLPAKTYIASPHITPLPLVLIINMLKSLFPRLSAPQGRACCGRFARSCLGHFIKLGVIWNGASGAEQHRSPPAKAATPPLCHFCRLWKLYWPANGTFILHLCPPPRAPPFGAEQRRESTVKISHWFCRSFGGLSKIRFKPCSLL